MGFFEWLNRPTPVQISEQIMEELRQWKQEQENAPPTPCEPDEDRAWRERLEQECNLLKQKLKEIRERLGKAREALVVDRTVKHAVDETQVRGKLNGFAASLFLAGSGITRGEWSKVLRETVAEAEKYERFVLASLSIEARFSKNVQPFENTPYSWNAYCEATHDWCANYLNNWERVRADMERFDGGVYLLREVDSALHYYRYPINTEILATQNITVDGQARRFQPIINEYIQGRVSTKDAAKQIERMRDLLHEDYRRACLACIAQKENEQFAKLSAELANESAEVPETEAPPAIIPIAAANSASSRAPFGSDPPEIARMKKNLPPPRKRKIQ